MEEYAGKELFFGLDAVCYFCLLLFVSPWGSNVLNFFCIKSDNRLFCGVRNISDL